MAENVVNQQEISLEGKRYRIAPRRAASVRSFIASRYPGKLVLGDVGSDSDPRRSVVKWTDQRGGLGVYKLDARDPELDRCSYTSCDVRYKGGITLPPLSRYTTGAGLVGDITAIGEHRLHGTSRNADQLAIRARGVLRFRLPGHERSAPSDARLSVVRRGPAGGHQDGAAPPGGYAGLYGDRGDRGVRDG